MRKQRLISSVLFIIFLISYSGIGTTDTIYLPEGLQKIEPETFMGDTSLDQVIIPDGAYSIQDLAFAQSGIQRIQIPNSVETISDNAFDGADQLTIVSDYNAYAREYAFDKGIPWEDLNQSRHHEILDIIDEDSDLVDVDLDDMVFNELSVEGITDPELLAIYSDFNNAQREAESILQEIREAGEAFLDLMDEIYNGNADLLNSVTESGLKLDGFSWTWDLDDLEEQLPGLTPVAIWPDPTTDAIVVEAERQGQSVYLYINAYGQSRISASRAAKLRGSRRALAAEAPAATSTPEPTPEPAPQGINLDRLRFVANNIREIATQFDTYWQLALNQINGILDGWEQETKALNNAESAVNRAHERVAAVAEVNPGNLEIQDMVTQQQSSLNRRLGEIANNKRIRGLAVKGVTRLNKLMTTINIPLVLNAIFEDISAADNLIDTHNHGHPTDADRANDDRIRLANELNLEWRMACLAVLFDTAMNITDLLSAINVMSTPIQACFGPAGLGIKALFSAGLALARRAVRQMTSWLVGVVADLTMKTAMDEMNYTHVLLHNYQEPTPTPSPSPVVSPPPPEHDDSTPPPTTNPGDINIYDSRNGVAIDAIHFPDPIMREYLRIFDNDIEDGYLSSDEMRFIVGFSDEYNSEIIQDITGLEYITTLKYLELRHEHGDTLDLRHWPDLWDVRVETCGLKELIVRDLYFLQTLHCGDNQLTALDLSGCYMKDLRCSGNQIYSLDLSDCSALWNLEVEDNHISELDLTNCPRLNYLYCSNNNLTELDLTGCRNLIYLKCYNNQIQSLDLSGLTILTDAIVSSNNLQYLSFSGCTALDYYSIENNPLIEINFHGCTSLKYFSFNHDYSTVKTVDISECTAMETCIITNELIENINIKGCTALKEICIEDNLLKGIDVSDCVQLESLDLRNNRLTSLDVSNCTKLKKLEVEDNQISELLLSPCTELQEVRCDRNPLTVFDVSSCKQLQHLACSEINLERLDVSNLEMLEYLSCFDSPIYALKILGCKALSSLTCYGTKMVILNIKGCDSLKQENIWGPSNIRVYK